MTRQPTSRHSMQELSHKRTLRIRWIIAISILLIIGIGTAVWILSSAGSWITIFPVVLFTVLGVVIGLFQWLFPISSDGHRSVREEGTEHSPSLNSILEKNAQPMVIGELPPPVKTTHRGIAGVLPPTDPRTIQQRNQTVKEIYSMLTRPDTTAVVLTGIGGIGKSTLAALVYRFTEEERLAGHGLFTAQTVWLHLDSATTMVDLAGNLFEALSKPIPDFSNLSLQHQAQTLFNALYTASEKRLVILDQFENLLDWQTGYALANRPGVGEWLDAINAQSCPSRLLLTSRPWPSGTRRYPPTHMQEYHVPGLETTEGIELLHKLGIAGQDKELSTVVNDCEGHAFALTLLSTFLRSHNLSLSAFFKNPLYNQIWTGNIARNLLDSIYHQHLDEGQRNLLVAFSIYREPVPLLASRALLTDSEIRDDVQLQSDLDVLLAQHLLQATNEGRYQLHAIVANYTQSYVGQKHQKVRQIAHAKAAHYYLQQYCPPRAMRQQINDIQPLIEAAWQWCQADEWQIAYELMEKEEFFSSLRSWGDNATLLELYQLLLPPKKWQAEHVREAQIYNNLGIVCRILGQMEEAQTYLEQALQIYQEAHDRSREAMTRNNLGRLYADRGDRKRALQEYEQALYLSQEERDRESEGTAHNSLGWLHVTSGESQWALQCYEQALSIFTEKGDLLEACRTLNNLGRVYEDREDIEQAKEYYEQALSSARQARDSRLEGWTLNNIGKIYGKLGQDKQAQQYLEQALHIRHRIDRKGEGRTLNNMGELFARQDQLQQALLSCKDALKISREVGDREGEGKTLYNLGLFYLQQERYDIALACLLIAQKNLREVQSPYMDRLERQIADLTEKDTLKDIFLHIEPDASQIVERVLGQI